MQNQAISKRLAQEIAKQTQLIQQHHALLVFPIKKIDRPLSLWQTLYPKTKMRWEWTENADNRVVKLWHTREILSRSRDVVYSKWFQGRATFFSKELMTYLLAYFEAAKVKSERRQGPHALLSRDAQNILSVLDMDSPLSTKQLKVAVGLQGKACETQFVRATKRLFQLGQIVGFGEFEDSSFPSLGYASTELIFEDVWLAAQKVKPDVALRKIEKLLVDQPEFILALKKLKGLF